MSKEELITEFVARFVTGDDSAEFYLSEMQEFISKVWDEGLKHGIAISVE